TELAQAALTTTAMWASFSPAAAAASRLGLLRQRLIARIGDLTLRQVHIWRSQQRAAPARRLPGLANPPAWGARSPSRFGGQSWAKPLPRADKPEQAAQQQPQPHSRQWYASALAALRCFGLQ
uniref:Homeobox domain-containing protein n=1 Tax=Macrostomum lignano TaxID=282301 RepID=A0A1I8FEY7_9PLAT